MDPKKILFVCEGNIIRSPLAKGMFNRLVEEAGLANRYSADACGTASYHVGEGPDSRMVAAAAGRGFQYKHTARQVTSADLDRFDLVIAMDTNNRENLRRLARTPEQRQKIHLMREYDPQAGPEVSVPDPYYGGLRGFEQVYDIVDRSVRGLLAALEKERG